MLTSISQALNPNKGTENAQRGIDLAQKVLSIPPILDAADMANPKVRVAHSECSLTHACLRSTRCR